MPAGDMWLSQWPFLFICKALKHFELLAVTLTGQVEEMLNAGLGGGGAACPRAVSLILSGWPGP